MHQLIEWDKWLFGRINREWINPFFDWLFPIVRNQYTWYPLYGLLIVFSIYWFRKNAIWWVVSLILTITASDQLGMLLKNYFGRLRPCRQTVMPFRLMIEYCPSSFSFVSNHASNHFAIATFIFFTLLRIPLKYRFLFFIWAALVCYAQVYVGVHYPADVFAGACTGFLVGWILSRLYNLVVSKFNLDRNKLGKTI